MVVIRDVVEISCKRRCPAVRLAVNRTPRAKGRISRLIVSTTIRIGISGMGVPIGRRCAIAVVGCVRSPVSTVPSHSGKASVRVSESWVVGVKVYGSIPRILMVRISKISEVRIGVHLWVGEVDGGIRFLIMFLVSQRVIVVCRLGVSRFLGKVIRIRGYKRVIGSSETPRAVGIEN